LVERKPLFILMSESGDYYKYNSITENRLQHSEDANLKNINVMSNAE